MHGQQGHFSQPTPSVILTRGSIASRRIGSSHLTSHSDPYGGISCSRECSAHAGDDPVTGDPSTRLGMTGLGRLLGRGHLPVDALVSMIWGDGFRR